MTLTKTANRVRKAVANATPEQRAAALPHAIEAVKAPSPRVRALAVCNWLVALGQNPRDWTLGKMASTKKRKR